MDPDYFSKHHHIPVLFTPNGRYFRWITKKLGSFFEFQTISSIRTLWLKQFLRGMEGQVEEWSDWWSPTQRILIKSNLSIPYHFLHSNHDDEWRDLSGVLQDSGVKTIIRWFPPQASMALITNLESLKFSYPGKWGNVVIRKSLSDRFQRDRVKPKGCHTYTDSDQFSSYHKKLINPSFSSHYLPPTYQQVSSSVSKVLHIMLFED